MLCLVAKRFSGKHPADIFGLYELRTRINGPYRLHRLVDSPALGDYHPQKSCFVARVGKPVPIKRAEPGRGEGLVDWGVVVKLGEAPGNRIGVVGEKLWEIGGKRIGVDWTRPVVKQTQYRCDPQRREMAEALIGPAPISLAPFPFHDFPKNRVPERSDAEFGDQIKIAAAMQMPRFFQLIAYTIPDPDNAAFDASPNLQPAHYSPASASSWPETAVGPPSRSFILSNVASACPTT